MTDSPIQDPMVDEVPIARTDLDVILEGLRELPHAMTQMANSVTVLAENTNKSPSKSYTAVLVLMASLLNLVGLGAGLYVIRDSQIAGAERGKATLSVVTQVADCLDAVGVDDKGQEGDCAKTLRDLNTAQQARVLLAVRCESQVTFKRFVLANPNLGVDAPTVEEPCLPYEHSLSPGN